MKFEYVLFNLVIIVGPVLSRFSPQIRQLCHWRLKLLVCGIVMIPYIIWDAIVTGSHWWFNETYTLDFRFLGLPLGEWLFFITVPFGCLLVWETLLHENSWLAQLRPLRSVRMVFYVSLPCGIWIFSIGKQYTGLVLLCLGLVGLTDMLLNVNLLLQPKTYLYLGIVAGLILVFNGYLTARPVVQYGEMYQSGYRILTIPIEDFGYGFTLMLFNVMLYEKLKATQYGK